MKHSKKKLTWIYYSFKRGAFQIVYDKPKIVNFVFAGNRFFPLLFLYPLAWKYRRNTAHFIGIFHWHCNDYVLNILLKAISRFRFLFPQHKFYFLANSEEELNRLLEVNLESVFCSHNCFVDEDLYKPVKNVAKKYDAVYNARITPFKRHELCSELTSLALITYYISADYSAVHFKRISNLLSHAWNFNKKDDEIVRLNPLEVNLCLNQCNVGLILSEVEGANYATVEYLLAGLPVISTKSKGGREIFLNSSNSIISEANSSSVNQAVKLIIDKNLSREEIRSGVLKIIMEHRKRYNDLINRIINNNDHEVFDVHDVLYNKFYKWQSSLKATL